MSDHRLPCPHCAESVSAFAKVCRHCHREIQYEVLIDRPLEDREKHELIKSWQSYLKEGPDGPIDGSPLSNYSESRRELDSVPFRLAWNLSRGQAQKIRQSFSSFPLSTHLAKTEPKASFSPQVSKPIDDSQSPGSGLLYAAGLFLMIGLGLFFFLKKEPEPVAIQDVTPSPTIEPPALQNAKDIQKTKTAPRSTPTSEDTVARQLTRQEMIRLLDSTVFIRDQSRLGTGFFISSDGYLISNSHVTSSMREPLVITRSGQTFRARKVREDTKLDLSLLKIERSGLPFLEMGDANQLYPGQNIITIGNPSGLSFTVTRGIVSYIGRKIKGVPFIQTDAAINRGNSGGPMITEDLKVVGINTLTSKNDEGISFAVPINFAYDIDGLASGIGKAPFGRPAFEETFDPVQVSNQGGSSSSPRGSNSPQLSLDHYKKEAKSYKDSFDRKKNRLKSEADQLQRQDTKLKSDLVNRPNDIDFREEVNERREEIFKRLQEIQEDQAEAKLKFIKQMISLIERQKGDPTFSAHRDKLDQELKRLHAARLQVEASLN